MEPSAKCPLCRLCERAQDLLKDQKAEEVAACAAAPLALMTLPIRLGCGFLRAGSFFIVHGLYGVKSFVDSACPPVSGQDAGQHTDRSGG